MQFISLIRSLNKSTGKTVFLLFCMGFICTSASLHETTNQARLAEDFTSYSYHRRIGIPKAKRIKSFERSFKKGQHNVMSGFTDVSKVPYQAGLIMAILWVFQSVCGGSLVSPTQVVTAAHCHHDGSVQAQTFTVVLGSSRLFSGGIRIKTSDISVHPQWDPETINNDIAVLKIPEVTLSNVIQPVALPSRDEALNSFVGVRGLASGFGYTSDSSSIGANQYLSSVELPIISNEECLRAYPGWVHDTNLCTSGEGGRGTCHGDSGGPLVVSLGGRRVLVGVTSFGSYHGCQAGDPAVFTRVTAYLTWILSI